MYRRHIRKRRARADGPRPGEKDDKHARRSTQQCSTSRRRHDGRAALVRFQKHPEKRRPPRFPDAIRNFDFDMYRRDAQARDVTGSYRVQ